MPKPAGGTARRRPRRRRGVRSGARLAQHGPQSLIELGLPAGFEARLERRDFDPGLVIWLAGRYDLVCFKLYAAADEWPTRGRHLQDLAALAPGAADLGHAARWVRSHDPSAGFRDRQLDPAPAGISGCQVDVRD